MGYAKRNYKLIPLMLLLSVGAFITRAETRRQKAARIHQSVMTVDTHSDTPMNLFRSDFNLTEKHDALKSESKVDFPRMKEGHLDAQFFAIFLSQGPRNDSAHAVMQKKTYDILNTVLNRIEKASDLASIATTPEEGYDLKRHGKLAIYLGVENGYAIGHDLTMISKLYDKGVRYITLCHTRNNDLCDSSTDKGGAQYNGLSPLGEQVVKEMNRVGMIIDVSHASDSTLFDVLRLTTKPIIASHSCSRAVCDNPRNLTDEGLKAIARNGGVIQMCILSDYVKAGKPNPKKEKAQADLREKYNNFQGLTPEQEQSAYAEWRAISKQYPQKLAKVKDAVDHIDHMVKIAGIDHVGIGTDFDGGGGLKDCFDVSQMGNITLELVRRGYSEEDIRKIWGGNFMRVFSAVIS